MSPHQRRIFLANRPGLELVGQDGDVAVDFEDRHVHVGDPLHAVLAHRLHELVLREHRMREGALVDLPVPHERDG